MLEGAIRCGHHQAEQLLCLQLTDLSLAQGIDVHVLDDIGPQFYLIIVIIVVRRRAAERLAEVMAAEQTGESPVVQTPEPKDG